MNPKTRAMADHVLERMKASKRPRNQIATISGLTNTYIRDLERGHIANVPREKLIAFATALNLDLNEIDTMLSVFDRTGLTVSDIEIFIDTARRGDISGALLPVRDMFAYELIVLSAELIPGSQIIVSDRPTMCMLAHGHRSHTDRSLLTVHPIYGELIEAIGNERRENFYRLLAHHPVELYICKQCLEDYLVTGSDRRERQWRARHVAALAMTLEAYPNLRMFLTRMCTNFNFTLKLPSQEKAPEKIFFSARAPHDLQRDEQGRLTGFATENPTVIRNFKDELQAVRSAVIEAYHDADHLTEYLRTLPGGAAATANGGPIANA
jgi:transcriptional regulator with XRE-family HTH domain